MTLSFSALWRQLHPDLAPEQEYRFDSQRRWRMDYAWPRHRVGLEFDGGQWLTSGGRHNRDSDRDKLNHAAAQHWLVLRFSNQQWQAEPLACIRLVEDALCLHATEAQP